MTFGHVFVTVTSDDVTSWSPPYKLQYDCRHTIQPTSTSDSLDSNRVRAGPEGLKLNARRN